MNILFVCTANSCRSQMAEAWARRLFPPGWVARSAGLLTYRITDPTRRVLAEVGLDLSGQESKPIDRFDLDAFDLVVTLSEEAGRFLPALSRPERHVHRPLDDPMAFEGDPAGRLAAFRTARDAIADLVAELAGSESPSGDDTTGP